MSERLTADEVDRYTQVAKAVSIATGLPDKHRSPKVCQVNMQGSTFHGQWYVVDDHPPYMIHLHKDGRWSSGTDGEDGYWATKEAAEAAVEAWRQSAAARAASGLTLLTAEQRKMLEGPIVTPEPTPMDKAKAAALSAIDRYAAENARLKEQLAKAERKIEIYRRHDLGHLFCWCVENLGKFPPIEGEWTDEVKRRLQQLAAKERDSERLDYLDALVKHPPFRCDVILQHDHEDGVWLASIERGRAYGVTPIDSDISTPHLDVRAAIDSAAKERPLNIAPAAEGGGDAQHT